MKRTLKAIFIVEETWVCVINPTCYKPHSIFSQLAHSRPCKAHATPAHPAAQLHSEHCGINKALQSATALTCATALALLWLSPRDNPFSGCPAQTCTGRAACRR